MSALKQLIVNADDLGLSAAINEGIIKAHVSGLVTSTSLVASGQSFGQGVELARLYEQLGVGVHLTLVEENSVSSQSSIPTLAPHGVLPSSYGELTRNLAFRRIRLRDVEFEWRAQIEKCLLAGIKITHLDSHQHTHALPMLFPLAVKLANNYKIPGIRVPRGFPSLHDIALQRFLPKCALSLLAHADLLMFGLETLKTTNHFAGLFESGALDQTRLSAILNKLRPGTTELVAHPGIEDSSPRYANWNKRRQVELASLTNESAKSLVTQLQIQLINYRQI